MKKIDILKSDNVRVIRFNQEREHWHEGIEREDVKTTSGVHWTQDEMRAYVNSFNSLEDLLEMDGE